MSISLIRLVGDGALPIAQVRPPSVLFNRIFTVFLLLGTLVGVVVIGYMTWKAWKYREGTGRGKEADIDRPQVGEIPQGGGGGRKLFLSFGISTVIVVGLIVWTYGALLAVETGPPQQAGQDPVEVDVVGFQFAWQFQYENGIQTTGTLRVPADRPVKLQVTSRDVFHNFGIPALRVKADAIPGQTTDTWFIAEEPGRYQAQCYELCGVGHSYMTATVIVMEPQAYQQWVANQTQNASA
ncbi:MAG: cytochrome c oxidase subunit II [Halodesulfurarchaeum sp.]